MRRGPRLLSAAIAGASLAVGASASGEAATEEVGETTTTAAETIVRDTREPFDEPGPFKPFAIEINPLGLVVGGRLSLQAEWAFAAHHVVVVNPQFQSTTGDVTRNGVTEDWRFQGVGGELGYRYYTGRRGMNGVFLGPSVIAGIYNASMPGSDQAFSTIGVAADVGVQQIFFDHLVIGGGVGLQYLAVSEEFGDLPSGPGQIGEDGVKPRLLLSAGYAF